MLRRVVCAAILVALALIGLSVHLLLPDTAVTDIAGDALYAAAVYVFLVLVLPRQRPLVIGAIALAWCVAIELFQLTGVPLAVGARFPPAMLVLGTVFDPRDLVVYALTIFAATALDSVLARLRTERP
ncbi:ribosomal maturation YjgA family protein [Microbacterium schleiferi]|uniref:DUF2809 domain-containing protein n=1 Tax=Microbacterium schleiferi TaxID=69362 RepID=A0ABU7V2X7_9MICO|nr:DUF2809 domain-containing protein [Micrococcales bacterium]